MSLMENEEKQRWPYLSPARPGWELVDGVRGDVRALLLRGNADAIAEKRESNDAAGVVLDFIEDVNRLLVMLQNELIGLVTESYYRGVSWQDLARRLDRSKQSVHQRYHRRVHARATHESLRADLEVVLRRVQANPRPYPPESPGSPTASVGDSRSGKA